jgi:hypothetical protein
MDPDRLYAVAPVRLGAVLRAAGATVLAEHRWPDGTPSGTVIARWVGEMPIDANALLTAPRRY